MTESPYAYKEVQRVPNSSSELTIPFRKFILDNGLTVIISEDHSSPVVHVDVTYHVGSSREVPGKSGFAHFFEHMMFQGSEHVGDQQHFKIVTEAGGVLNGTTNTDRTNYFQTVPANQLEKMLWLESDRMGFLLDAVIEHKFEIQRATVKNERAQNYDNRAYGLAREVLNKTLYPYGHPYSWLPIGYMEDIDRLTLTDLKHFFLRWYGPNNAVLTVAGDVDTEQVLPLIQKYFGPIPPGPEVKPVQAPTVFLDRNRYVSYTDAYAQLPMIQMAFPTVPDFHPDKPALACLAQVVGQGRNSLTFKNLIKPKFALQAGTYSLLSELAGTFTFFAVPAPGQTLADMENLFRKSLLEFEQTGVSDDDLQTFKAGFESRLIQSLSSISGKASQLASFETFTGNPDQTGNLLKQYHAVTKEDVARVYTQYIQGKSAVIVSVVPKGREHEVAAPDNFTPETGAYTPPDYGYDQLIYRRPVMDFDRQVIPAAGPNPVIPLPPLWRDTMPGNIQIIGTENNELPLISVSIYLKGGILTDQHNLEKAGLANFFAEMMSEDTLHRSSEEINMALEKLGSTIRISQTTDAILFSVSSLTRHIAETMAIVQEKILHPHFTQDAFERIKTQTLEGIRNSLKQASTVASNVFRKLIYGTDTSFGFPADGTEDTVQNITLDDVKAWHDTYITGLDAQVVVAGDVSRETILPHLHFLLSLPEKKYPAPFKKPHPRMDEKTVYVVDVPDAAQTEFRIGIYTGVAYDATGEFYKSTLAGYNFGGNFNSRLNIRLREEKAWTYGAQAWFTGNKYTGNFTISTGIKKENTADALLEITSLLNEYAAFGPSDEELIFMKNSIGQSDARKYETLAQKAQFISRILLFDLDEDFVAAQNEILNNITKSELDMYVKEYFDASSMTFLIVGDLATYAHLLAQTGYKVQELNSFGEPV